MMTRKTRKDRETVTAPYKTRKSVWIYTRAHMLLKRTLMLPIDEGWLASMRGSGSVGCES